MPLEFFLWGTSKENVCYTAIATQKELWESIIMTADESYQILMLLKVLGIILHVKQNGKLLELVLI